MSTTSTGKRLNRWMEWKQNSPIFSDAGTTEPSKPTEPCLEGCIGSRLSAEKMTPNSGADSLYVSLTGCCTIDGKRVREVVRASHRMVWFIDEAGREWRYFPELGRSFEVIDASRRSGP